MTRPLAVLPGLTPSRNSMESESSYRLASESLENSLPSARSLRLFSSTVPSESPLLVALRLSLQNWPCAFLPTYWSPTLLMPHSNLVTLKVQSPASTFSPILAAAGAAGALLAGALLAGALLAAGASADVEAAGAAVVGVSPPPLNAWLRRMSATSTSGKMKRFFLYQGRMALRCALSA